MATRKTKSTKKRLSKLRVGFIGAGGIAHAHAKQYKNIKGVEMIAAADVSGDNLKKMADEYGIEAHYKDWKDMLAKEELDAVSVCTPNFLHYQPTLDALNAGCHVLVEKPLAMNAVEGHEMATLARKKGLICTIAFQHRFAPNTLAIKQAVDAGTLGDIMFAKVFAMRRRGIPNWGVFGQKKLQGGGPMIDIGVHAMEMTHYAMGRPKPVAAVGNTWTYMGNKKSKTACQWPNWDHKTYDVEDYCVGHIRFDTGAIMQVEAMFAGHIGNEEQGMKFRLVGTKGGARNTPLEFYYDKDGHMMTATPAYIGREDIWVTKMNNFASACMKGTQDLSPVEDGLAIQKMIDGIYQSADAGGKEVLIK